MRRVTTCLLAAALASLVVPARADDKIDCIQAFDKGQALRNDQKLVESASTLLVCARDVCPAMVRKDCDDLLQRTQKDVPSLVFAAKSPTGADLVAVKIYVDGTLVAPTLDGRAVHVNPGAHAVRFETEGAKPIEQTILAREGEKDRSISVQFEAPPPPVVTPPPVVAPPPPTPIPMPHETMRSSPAKSSPLRWIGVAVGAAGVVSLGIGAGLAVAAKSKWDDAVKQCGAGCLPGSPAYATRGDANTLADVSTATVIAGAVLVAGGVALFIVAPKPGRAASVALHPGLGGLSLDGVF